MALSWNVWSVSITSLLVVSGHVRKLSRRLRLVTYVIQSLRSDWLALGQLCGLIKRAVLKESSRVFRGHLSAHRGGNTPTRVRETVLFFPPFPDSVEQIRDAELREILGALPRQVGESSRTLQTCEGQEPHGVETSVQDPKH